MNIRFKQGFPTVCVSEKYTLNLSWITTPIENLCSICLIIIFIVFVVHSLFFLYYLQSATPLTCWDLTTP